MKGTLQQGALTFSENYIVNILLKEYLTNASNELIDIAKDIEAVVSGFDRRVLRRENIGETVRLFNRIEAVYKGCKSLRMQDITEGERYYAI